MIRVEACGLTEGTGGSFVLAQMRVCNSKQRPGLPAIGMGCQRSSEAGSFAGVSPEIFCAGQIEGGPPIIGMLSGKAFEQGLCLLRLMQAEIERPKAHRLCIIQRQAVDFVSHSQSLLKNPFGLVWLAKRPLQETQVAISFGESGIEPDRLVIFRRRLAGHSQTRQSDAAKVARSGVRGMLLFSLREFLQGLAKLPLFKQEQAAAKVVCRL